MLVNLNVLELLQHVDNGSLIIVSITPSSYVRGLGVLSCVLLNSDVSLTLHVNRVVS